MAFSKNFPRTSSGSSYPQWEEIILTTEEEIQVEDLCRKENYALLDQCLTDAKLLAIKHSVNTDENRARLAIALFEKRAAHVVFWKEEKAKENFNQNKEK